MSGPDPVVVEFATRGIDDVLKAFASIEDRLLHIERRSAAVAKMSIAAGNRAVDAATKAATRNAANAALTATSASRSGNGFVAGRAQAAYERHSATAVSSAQQASVYRAMQAEERRVRALVIRGPSASSSDPSSGPAARLKILSEAKGRPVAEMHAALERSKDLGSDDRARLGAERDLTRAVAVESKKRASMERDVAKQAQADLDERVKREEAITRQRREAAKVLYGAGKNAVMNATSTVGRAASMVANLGGGFSIEDSLRREVSARGRAAQIAATTNTGISEKELMSTARGVAIKNGLDPEEVLRGMEAVKKLDDSSLPIALKAMPQMAQLASATGTDLGSMGELAANVTAANPEYFASKSVSDDEKAKRLDSQLRIFTQQGISGGVEVPDFAKYGSRITAGAALFGGDREHNEAMLGAGAQLARQRGGASSAAEATLASQRFATDLQKKAGALKKLGIDVADKNGSLRDLGDVTIDMLKKQSSVTGISEFKIGERGNRYLTGAADLYRSAGGGAAGEKAVRGYFKTMTSGISSEDVAARATKRNSAVDKQLDIALVKLRSEIGDKLVPVLPPLIDSFTKLIPTIGRLLDQIAKVADWAARNPFEGFAALVTGFFLKELAAAKIGEVIQGALSGRGGGLGPLGPGAGPGTGPGKSAGGSSGGMLALGGIALTVGEAARQADQIRSSINEGDAAGQNVAADLRSGDPAKVAAAQQSIDQAQAQHSAVNQAMAGKDVAGRAFDMMFNPAGLLASGAADAAVNAFGYQSSADRRNATFKAGAMLDNESVQKDISNRPKAAGQPGQGGTEPITATIDPANVQVLAQMLAALQQIAGNTAGGPGQAPAPVRRMTSYSRGPDPSSR